MAQEMLVMPIADGYSEFFIVRDQATNEPLAGFPYTLTFSGGTLRGETDANGETQRAWSKQSEEIALTPHPEHFRRNISAPATGIAAPRCRSIFQITTMRKTDGSREESRRHAGRAAKNGNNSKSA
ncbi:hypothetical protein QMW84_20955 [Cronobacter sakazakii]|nr:hypothetical protein [Cronobacter sakazakii]MDI7565536.1 hypothetical protein [Cronobacter sakazakii]MDI7570091.1 hypothetical protein [Cronobacter sakazakii]MDI7572884.1 hypothetical protein [Cronobacter sakazakii]MDI7576100.1 hypothetical protein [Cronobacter sakazakii]